MARPPTLTHSPVWVVVGGGFGEERPGFGIRVPCYGTHDPRLLPRQNTTGRSAWIAPLSHPRNPKLQTQNRCPEAPVGIEPTNERFAVSCLTTWLRRRYRREAESAMYARPAVGETADDPISGTSAAITRFPASVVHMDCLDNVRCNTNNDARTICSTLPG